MNMSVASTSQLRKSSNQNIQVYVRVRPINARERCIRSTEVVEVISPREVVARHSLDSKLTKKFTFDRTFGPDSRQVDVYSTVVSPLIEEVLAGYNCTVFAYGQTGTGKTHTMIGNECAALKSCWEDDSDIGIIPRALSHLFDELRLMEMEFSMRISYLELYNEELCDLLSTDDNTKIRIFDDSTKKGSVIIQGLEEIPVHSKDDVYKLLEKGKERRKTASTLMNAQSSRSHTVFSILVYIRENGIDGEEMLKIGKLNLVDLAGSENVTKSGNEKGIRVRETVNINQSLLTLGRVITALVERTPHVPYRESKLTRLLQESLGGRTKTSIIATISPGHKDIEETLSTLEYAHRAKNIQNKPEVNQKLTKKIVLKEHHEEIEKLKRDLMAAREKNGIYLAEQTYNEITFKMDSQNRELNEKALLLKALKDELVNKEKIFNEVSLNLVEKTEELKRTERNLHETNDVLHKTKQILTTTQKRYKEKRVLLESHVKTEEKLTNQANQLLEVADLATNDTQQLHSTIERRKSIDKKIESACEQFAERMRNNFGAMDEKICRFQEDYEDCSAKLVEEFTNCTNIQNKIFGDANQRISQVRSICKQSVVSTAELSEKYKKLTSELSTEHKDCLITLLEELKSQEAKQTLEIKKNINELENCHSEQKTQIANFRKDIDRILNQSLESLFNHTKEVKQQIATAIDTSNAGMAELVQLQNGIEQVNEIVEEEQAIIADFVAKMQSMKQKHLNCASQNRMWAEKVEKLNIQGVNQLKQSSDFIQLYQDEQHLTVEEERGNLSKQADSLLTYVDNGLGQCTLLHSQMDALCEQSTKISDSCADAENAYLIALHKTAADNSTTLSQISEHMAKCVSETCDGLQTAIIEDTNHLKDKITHADGLSSELRSQVYDYAKDYNLLMNECVKNVENFRQHELKTYAPTGATPSKRNFTYPRVLAATSPHNQIIKRVRQENNNCSDLDLTVTIEELNESEGEQISAHMTLDDNAIVNSTPIEKPRQPDGILSDLKMNALRTAQLMCNGSLSTPVSSKSTPIIDVPTDSFKENKENVE